jgi:hypothetical protein
MLRMTIPIVALVSSALAASCTGVNMRVLGVNLPSVTTERVQEKPEYRGPTGFPPLCHRGPEEPTGPSPAPETCHE